MKRGEPSLERMTWASVAASELTAIGLDDRLADVAFEQRGLLGCSFCDALAPALAEQLGATPYSADVRAHARFAGVQLL